MRRIVVDASMKEITPHGTPGFPLVIHDDDFADFQEGFIPWHWHKEVQFSMVLSSLMEFHVESESITLGPGDGILINKNVLHHIRPVADRTGTMFSLDFDESLVGGDPSSLVHQKYVETLTENGALKLVRLDGDAYWQADATRILMQLREVYTQAEYGYELSLKALLCSLWHTVTGGIRPDLERALQVDTPDSERVRSAVQYIMENFGRSLTLGEIASSVHVSKSECCRSFRRVIKMSPVGFVLQTRVHEAAKLLGVSGQPISDLAASVGFNDVSYFGKVFRQQMGCSPRDYRRETLKRKVQQTQSGETQQQVIGERWQ
jgi:AraC family transcriptional regulator, melibiose operon regulatory protein